MRKSSDGTETETYLKNPKKLSEELGAPQTGLELTLKVLGVIPARGGSKGIPGKNIKLFGGIPLICHTLNAAKKSGCLDRIWVSTDEDRIASIARKYGGETPWLRPRSLAQDDSRIVDVLIHLLNILKKDEGYQPDAVMLLQPTSPLRLPETIRKAVKMFKDLNQETVMSVTLAPKHPYWCYRVRANGVLDPFISNVSILPRQKLPLAYVPDGSVYLVSVRNFLKHRSFHARPVHALVVPAEEAVDIDSPADWIRAEILYYNRKRTISRIRDGSF